MSDKKSLTLTFGEQSFPIRPFNLPQVIRLSKLFADNPDVSSMSSKLDLAQEAIMIALSRDHKEVKPEDLEVDMQMLPRQFLEIMAFGSFATKAEASTKVDEALKSIDQAKLAAAAEDRTAA